MIAALVNLTPGVGRTTLAVNLAGELALQGKRVALLDVDGCAGSREWAGRRRANGLPALFDTITSSPLRCGVWGLATSFDHILLDTPARSPAAVRAALLAAETVLGLRLPLIEAVIRERWTFAESRSTGLLVPELELAGRAEVEVRHLVSEVFGWGSASSAG